jgi:hypothetical protein
MCEPEFPVRRVDASMAVIGIMVLLILSGACVFLWVAIWQLVRWYR